MLLRTDLVSPGFLTLKVGCLIINNNVDYQYSVIINVLAFKLLTYCLKAKDVTRWADLQKKYR